jgi:hypothetical protein
MCGGDRDVPAARSMWKEKEDANHNGADQEHPTAPTLPPPVEDSGELIQLPEDLKTKLKEPLPAAAVSSNPGNPGLSAIKAIYLVKRLNDVFGLRSWRGSAIRCWRDPACLGIPTIARHAISKRR